MTTDVLAVDLGGTRIKAGLVQDGRVVRRDVLMSDSAKGLAPRLPALADLLDGLLDGGHPTAVGMAVPGIVDRRTMRLSAINAKWSDAPGLDLAGWVQERWSAPFVMDNDAVAALAGEWRHGAGRDTDGAVMMTLGTGIGVSAVVDGRILRGSHGQAAIAGHLTVNDHGRTCTCGNIGCAEAQASVSVLPTIAREDVRYPDSELARHEVDYASVFRLAAGDPLAKDLRDESVRVWSALAVSLIHAYDPEVLIVGGGVAAAGEALFSPLREYVRRHAWTPWGSVAIVPAELGDDAALLGMGVIARGQV